MSLQSFFASNELIFIMKIVITGATGAIGMALLEKHLQLGHEILVIVNPNSKRNCILNKFKNLEIIECDLNEYSN